MARAFAVGEKVLILDSKKRRYLATLSEGGQFHSHSGVLEHNDIVGSQEGTVLKSTKGAHYSILRPTLEDFVLEMPRGAQVIYPKDLAPICMIGDIGPGMRVFETGVGSGGGLLVAYTPSITQAVQVRKSMGDAWIESRTIEVLHRSWHIEGMAVRPDHRMVAHTAFLTVSRFIGYAMPAEGSVALAEIVSEETF